MLPRVYLIFPIRLSALARFTARIFDHRQSQLPARHGALPVCQPLDPGAAAKGCDLSSVQPLPAAPFGPDHQAPPRFADCMSTGIHRSSCRVMACGWASVGAVWLYGVTVRLCPWHLKAWVLACAICVARQPHINSRQRGHLILHLHVW